MTVFTFPYVEERTREGLPIFRPSALIYLRGADGLWKPFRVYADAGADVTLLTITDCYWLGYEWEAGRLQLMGGICSGLIRTFVHLIPLRLGTEEFLCSIAFAERVDVPSLLGRSEVFKRFKVCYDDVERVTKFILR